MNSERTIERNVNEAVATDGWETADAFILLFAAEAEGLYLLALLLTADAQKAAQCIEMARKHCMSGHSVCKGWARTWARHVVVKHSIRLLANRYGNLADMLADARNTPVDPVLLDLWDKEFAEYMGVLAFRNLDRLVFVLCVLEEYSTHECALLLGKSPHEIIEAQHRAIEKTVGFGRDFTRRETTRQDSIPSGEGTNKESAIPGEWIRSLGEWIRSFGCLSNGHRERRFSLSADGDSCGGLLG